MRVIQKRALKGRGRELHGHIIRQSALVACQRPQHAFILAGLADNAHMREVLCGGTQQGDATDVDLLERLCDRHVALGERLLKWVEVDDYEVDEMC